MTTCPNGHGVREGQPFCGECGAEVLLTCPEGHTTGASNQFCTECGAALRPTQGDDPPSGTGLNDQPSKALTRTRRAPWPVIAGLVGVAVVVGLVVAAIMSRGGDETGTSTGATQVESAQQFLQDRCEIPGDGSLTHLSTSPGDDGLTEISFTTSEDFVGTVYVDENDEFLDEVDCPGSDENAIVVPPEWEGVGDPVEYLVASECGFGPETRFDLSLISISDAAPGERPTWEIGLPDGTIGRLLPDGEIECPDTPPSTTPDDPQQSSDPPSTDGDPSCPDPLPERLSPEQAAACTMEHWAEGDTDGALRFTLGPTVLDPLLGVEPQGLAEPFGCTAVEFPPPGNPNEQFGEPLICVYQVSDGLTANLYVDATPSAGGYVFAVSLGGVD